MKKFKKIALVLGITLLLAVMGVVSVSAVAPSVDIPEERSSTPSIWMAQYAQASDCSEIKNITPHFIVIECVFDDGVYDSAILLKPFFEDFDINPNMTADAVWNKIINSPTNESGYDWFTGYLNDGCYNNSGSYYISEFEDAVKTAYNEQYVYWCNYSEEYANEQKEPLETQIGELNTTITEKDSTILALENENAVLESSVEGLNTQVNGLVKDKSELNATVKSLEKQLQIKIDKAYAEGLTDADGNVNVLSIIALVFTAVEVIALVVFIITRVRKNKFKKNKGGR